MIADKFIRVNAGVCGVKANHDVADADGGALADDDDDVCTL